MARLVRLAVQVVLFFLLLAVVIAIARPELGTAEKIVLVPLGIGLVLIAHRVRAVGFPRWT